MTQQQCDEMVISIALGTMHGLSTVEKHSVALELLAFIFIEQQNETVPLDTRSYNEPFDNPF